MTDLNSKPTEVNNVSEKPKPFEKIMANGSVSRIKYSGAANILEVEFAGKGSVYHYNKVPYPVWLELFKTPSAGKFIEVNIKGKYEYKKIK